MPKGKSKKKDPEADVPLPTEPESADTKRRRDHCDDFDVKQVRIANGISKDAFITRGHLPQKMEIFQLRINRGLSAVKYFTGLTELVVLCQKTVTNLRGIEACPNLVTLWINQCELKQIDDSIKYLSRLRSLHICSNKIKSIQNLDRLKNLEILWLNDNRITSLNGLQSLSQLRVLWVANNRLTKIGTTLDSNNRLAELNLAGNQIGAFKEVLNLTRTLSLRSLCLSDPHFGDNPACLLCNYQTYVLYHLNQLSSLDTMLISNESKQLAEATYMKKKMYYNMRIKTLKRNTNNVIRKAQEAMHAKISLINLNLNVLLRQRKGIQGVLEEFEYLPIKSSKSAKKTDSETGDDSETKTGDGNENDKNIEKTDSTDNAESKTNNSEDIKAKKQKYTPGYQSQLRKKLKALDDAIANKGHVISRMESLFEQLKRHLCDVSEENIARLIVELETGGNIRLEDGKATDVWYSSCVDLLKSRFFARDFRAYGVGDIRVNRVTRIHNRFLRNRFDNAMEDLMRKNNIAPGGGKRQLEYLFFGEEPRLAKITGAGNELLRVADQGLRSAREFRRLGLDEAIKLSNSVSLTHLPQIRKFLSDCARNIRYEKGKDTNSSKMNNDDDTDSNSWMDTVAVAGSGAAAAAAAAARKRLQESNKAMKGDADIVDSASLREAAAALNRGEFSLPSGQILVVKVFLGNVATESGTKDNSKTGSHSKKNDDTSASDTSASSDNDSSEESESDEDQASVDSDGSESSRGSSTLNGNGEKTIKQSAYPEFDAVYRVNANDAKQREWFVFDNGLVLPEYLIEFDLITQATRLEEEAEQKRKEKQESGEKGKEEDNESKPTSSVVDEQAQRMQMAVELLGRKLTAQEVLDMGPLLRPLKRFMHQCKRIVERTSSNSGSNANKQNVPNLSPNSLKASNAVEGNGLPPAPVSLINNMPNSPEKNNAHGQNVLNMPPHLPSNEKLFEITKPVVLRRSLVASCDLIVYLNLHGCNIRQIDNLNECVNLKHLILSFNEIHKIEGLEDLVLLERLELGFNLIKRIEGLRGLEALKKVELNNNLIYRLEDIGVLRKYLPLLSSLDLRNNAVCDVKGYRANVLRRIPSLNWFDGKVINDDDRKKCSRSSSTITEEDILQSGKSTNNLVRQSTDTGIGGGSTYDANGNDTGDKSDSLGSSSDGAFGTLEQLDLNHRGIHSIENLEKCKNLRRLSLADNEISQIQGLDENTLLEELVLDENKITKFEGLSKLVFLKKLDVGKNKICKFENLETLVHLTQLSIEDNEISSLNGLQSLKNLMELYACSNRIGNLKEIQHLKTLPKLIIVDLSGNSLCRQKNYRLYCVYYLRKLKVLDGIGVDVNEQQSAREKYSGKLTAEFLSEKIGHKYFEHIRELDLSSCRIREIEHLSGEEFSNLRELNLDNNMLTNIDGLHALWKLQILRMNHNRVRELGLASLGNVADHTPENTYNPYFGLEGLTNLEVLQLGYNHVTDIVSLNLHKCKNLKVLFLQGNDIARIDGLNESYELRELVLDKNRVKYVDTNAFLGLTNLRELRLEENGLRSLSNFRNVHNLQLLYLGMNRISDMNEIDKLSSIPFLMELTLANNPVSRKQLYRANVIRRMPTLKIVDGREIGVDERERVELMFVADTRPPNAVFFADQALDQYGVHNSMSQVGNSRGTGTARAVKLTSVNFETLTGLAHRRQQASMQNHQNYLDSKGLGLPNAAPENFFSSNNNNDNFMMNGGGRRSSSSSNKSNSSNNSKTSYSLISRRGNSANNNRVGGSFQNSYKTPSLSSNRRSGMGRRVSYPPR